MEARPPEPATSTAASILSQSHSGDQKSSATEKKDETLPTRKKRLLAAFIYVLVGLLTTLILIVVKNAFRHTPDGQQAEYPLFGFLQRFLPDFDQNNPVVVIDISEVSENQEELIPILHVIVDGLKTLQRRPIAVAVDVDFSPTGPLSNDAIEFFEACLKRQNDDVPIFLAVGNNKSAPPGQRLGLEEYEPLVAAVAINQVDTKWIPIWLKANDGAELNTLNYVLALKYPGDLPGPPSWIADAVETGKEGAAVTRERGEVDPDQVTLTYAERLVNYSKLATMKSSKKTVRNLQDAESIKNDNTSFSGKLVLIGDVDQAKDKFPVPTGRINEAGSLLLASSTYTLVKEPLFAFKTKVEKALDLIIAALIIFPVAFIRYKYPKTSSLLGKQAVYIYLAIVIVLASGWLLVRYARVIWPDFFFVWCALVLHPTVEKIVHPILAAIWRFLAKLKPSKSSSKSSPPPATGAIAGAIVVLITSIITSTVQAQQQRRPESLCDRGVGVVAVELKRDSKATKQKKTCQYCESNKDCYNAPWHDISERDLWKAFRHGEKLRCSKPCTLVIYVCGLGKIQPINYIERNKRPGWYTVVNVYRIPRIIADPNRETPAKKIRWSLSYARPANPDPSDYSTTVQDASMTRLLESQMLNLNLETFRQAIAQASPSPTATPSPTPRSTQSSSAAATATGEQTASTSERVKQSAGTTTTAATTTASQSSEIAAAEQFRKQLDEFTKLLDRGNAERDAKNFMAAEQTYWDAVKLIPFDPRSWSGLGNVYFDQQNWPRAETFYRVATRYGTSSPEVYVTLGTLLIDPQQEAVDPNRLNEAERFLWTAATLQPQNEKPYNLLDIVLKKREAKPEELEATYRRALGLNPFSVGTNLRLSSLLRSSGRKEEAKKNFEVAEEAASTPEELVEVAAASESIGKLDKAQRFANRALKLDNKNARAHLILGLVKIDREKYSAALPLLQKAIEYNKDDFVARYLSAIAHLEIGNLDQSERLFDEATTRISTGAESDATAYWLTVLGDAYVQKGRKADALRVFAKALKQNPADGETRDKVANMNSTPNP